MSLSVIVPAYNEEENIRHTLEDIHGFLKGEGKAFEIVVIDDGSRDKTPTILKELSSELECLRVLTHPECQGKGEAVKDGVAQARHELCLFMDADNSTSIHEWPAFREKFNKGADVAIASRHLKESKIVVPQPFLRSFLGSGYRWICRNLFKINVSDFNCGFKAYKTPIAQQVYSEARMRDWTFDIEIFCLLKKYEIVSSEVPVSWTHSEKKTRIKPIRTALKTFVSLYKLKSRFSRP